MLLTAPIEYRDVNILKKCAHCGHIQTEEEGMSAEEFLLDQHYLDFCPVNVQEKYFKEKYVMCDNCGNIGKHITTNNIEIIGKEQYEKLLEITDETERKFLMMHIRYNSLETLIDLYWYYQYKNNKMQEKNYRNKIIEFYNRNDVENKLLLIEMYRRNGLFDKALETIKQFKKYNNESFYGIPVKYILENQKQFCKNNNDKREVMRAK